MDDCLELGYISGVYGVNGLVKIYSYTRPTENICKYNDFLTHSGESITFSRVEKKGKNIVGKIPDIDDRDKAERFKGKTLFIKKESLPKLEGEYYWVDLIGLNVIDVNGDEIGTVTKLIETGANDVLIINDKEQNEILIPFVLNHYVINVDLGLKQILVDWKI